jgi:hypothetical protein
MYKINYWFRDPYTVQERWGSYYLGSLAEVYAFGDMVKGYGGTSKCNLSRKY